jgi:hypothetical protein
VAIDRADDGIRGRVVTRGKRVRLCHGLLSRRNRTSSHNASVLIVVDVYHEFRFPAEIYVGFAKALIPNGRLAVIDFATSAKSGRAPSRWERHVRLTPKEAVAEITSNGFRLVSLRNLQSDSRYLAVFERLPR